jgi:hypothetical protein
MFRARPQSILLSVCSIGTAYIYADDLEDYEQAVNTDLAKLTLDTLGKMLSSVMWPVPISDDVLHHKTILMYLLSLSSQTFFTLVMPLLKSPIRVGPFPSGTPLFIIS